MAEQHNPSRRHHYVPRLLLRRFADPGGTLWVYDLVNGRIFSSHPSSAGVKKQLYSRRLEGGVVDHISVERFLAENVEGPGDAAIRRLLKREVIGVAGVIDFLRLVAVQLIRTPAYLEQISSMMQPLLREMTQRMARHDSEFRQRVGTRFRALGVAEEETERVLQAVGCGGAEVEPTKEFCMALAFGEVNSVLEELRKMGWQFAELDEADDDLILGDQPVLLSTPGNGSFGLRHPEIEIKVPLSTRVAAIGKWDSATTYARLRSGAAERINEDTMRAARRFIFASYRSEDLLTQAKALHGTGPRTHVHRIDGIRGPAFVMEFR